MRYNIVVDMVVHKECEVLVPEDGSESCVIVGNIGPGDVRSLTGIRIPEDEERPSKEVTHIIGVAASHAVAEQLFHFTKSEVVRLGGEASDGKNVAHPIASA